MSTRQSGTRVALYARISDDKHRGAVGEGLGVKRQQEDCQALADVLSLTVAGVYVDNDRSAYSGKERPEYQRLLTDLRSGKVHAVICWHTDRLHRSPRELEDYIDVCESHNVSTHTVKSGPLDLSTPAGRMAARIYGAVARNESEHKSERIKRKNLQRAQDGDSVSAGRAFGYDADGSVNLTEAAEIRKMTSAVLSGESLASIIRDLNGRGVLSIRGNAWRYVTVRELIMRPRNAGLVKHHGQIVGKGKWTAIVTEEDFYVARQILSDPKRKTTTGNARKHLLSGLVRCGHCGAPMRPGNVTMPRGKHNYSIYRCPKQGAGHVSREKLPVESFVTALTLTVLSNPNMRKLLAPATEDAPDLSAERDRITAQLDELAEAYANGALNISQLTKASENLRARLVTLESQLADAARGDAVKEFLTQSDLIAAWGDLSLSRKREVIAALMTVTIDPVGRGGNKRPDRKPWDGISVALNGGIRQLFGIATDAAISHDLHRVLSAQLTEEQETRIKRAFAA